MSPVGHSTTENRSGVDMRARLLESQLFGQEAQEVPWRVSPEPFSLTPEQLATFEVLGDDLLRFYRAVDELFRQSLCQALPAWVREYLTMRIDEPIREMGMSKAMRGQQVHVIRPDVLLTQEGMAITELDSVPGGIGWTAALNHVYEGVGFGVVGEGGMMEKGFARVLAEVSEKACPAWAIVVSQESMDYWQEMQWLGERLRGLGLDGNVLGPEDLMPLYPGLQDPEGRRIDIVYRFFELFDYRSIPTWDLLVYALKQGGLAMTPPIKSYLEEKLFFALFHHPCLESFWRAQLGGRAQQRLQKIFPKTWILDPRPLPPQAIVPDLMVEGRPVQNWRELATLSQRQRRLVIKPSGYSPLAWGSRGVRMGHDLSQERWARMIDMALDDFSTCPYVLQRFHDPCRVPMHFYDATGEVVRQEGRVRLCPYYMVYGGKAHLCGILATVCPLDKKMIHGMQSAVMAPCMVAA